MYYVLYNSILCISMTLCYWLYVSIILCYSMISYEKTIMPISCPIWAPRFIFSGLGNLFEEKEQMSGLFSNYLQQIFAVCGQFCMQNLFMKIDSLFLSQKCYLRHIRCILEFPKLFWGVLKSYLTQNSPIFFLFSYIWTSNIICVCRTHFEPIQ